MTPSNSSKNNSNPTQTTWWTFVLSGGALGYISYDAIRYIEKLPNQKPDDLNFPDVEMGIFEDGIVFNHTINQAYYYFRSENRLAEITELLKEPAATRRTVHIYSTYN